jgi:hypothetical protein
MVVGDKVKVKGLLIGHVLNGCSGVIREIKTLSPHPDHIIAAVYINDYKAVYAVQIKNLLPLEAENESN